MAQHPHGGDDDDDDDNEHRGSAHPPQEMTTEATEVDSMDRAACIITLAWLTGVHLDFFEK
jgi:hypothetical protein